MGCTVSKPDDQTTVAHCRTRCHLISEAIQYRYSMADAHAAYAQSLRSLASSLDVFLRPSVSHAPPALSNRKMPSGRSHIQFDSARSSDSSQVRHSDVVINYSKHHPKPPTVSIEQHPKSPDRTPLMQNYNFAPYQDRHPEIENPNFSSYPYPPVNYGMPPMSSFYPFSMPSTSSNRVPSAPGATQSKEPVMPPDPPSPDGSAWDFLNPFGNYDRYYEAYTPNTSFRRLREEEGIPELEEVKDESEPAISAQASKRMEKLKEEEGVDHKLNTVSARVSSARVSSARVSNARVSSARQRSVRFSFEQEVHAKDTRREVEEGSVATPRVFHDDLEVVSEIKKQFEIAAGAVQAVAALLEAGTRHYHFKKSIRKVAGRFCCGLPSIPNSIDDESNYEDFNATRTTNCLSITLQKLYMWETKLLEEVQNEEILRDKYQRKCIDLENSDKEGSDPEKIEEIRSNIRKLSTRIRITLQVLRSISNKIIAIRDEELWPQTCELVQELMKMWEIMMECHQAHMHAIPQAKILDSIFFAGTNPSDSQMESTKQLQRDILSWLTSFTAWIHAQRNYVQTLNSWLMTGLNYEPEITEDGPVPFSPGRLGLSPVFIILNNWSDIVDKNSEHNAVEAISSLYIGVVQLREKQKLEKHQMLTANGDLKAISTLEREERLFHKELEAMKRKSMSLSTQDRAYLFRAGMGSGSAHDTPSLKLNLRRTFECIELFVSANARAYEELHMHSEEESSFAN